MRQLLQQLLQVIGHKVIPTSDGEEALKVLEREPVDLIVTDVLMPGKDGLELIREVHKNRPSLPIVVVSGGGYRLDKHSCLTTAKYMGASATLSKPFSLQEIQLGIDQAWAKAQWQAAQATLAQPVAG